MLVIVLRIEEFNVHGVLMDNGSSTGIIYLPAFQQMKLGQERLHPLTSLLVSEHNKVVIEEVEKLLEAGFII